MPTPTLTEVARQAGVAVSTVSRVLNRAPNAVPISTATQQRVRDVAERIGYVPSAAGRLLRTGKSRTIGVLGSAPDVYLGVGQSGFMAEIFAGIMRPAIQRHYNVSLLAGWDAQVSSVDQLANLGLVDGLLVVNRDLSLDPACASVLRGWPKPVVYALDFPVDDPGEYVVSPDDEGGGALAVEHLVAAGHRRIGFAKWHTWGGIFGRRQAGWAHGLRKAGIEPRAEWVLVDSDPDQVRSSGVTAILCANEPIAREIIERIRTSGSRVPEDVSVVAFGHQESAGRVSPRYSDLAMVMHPLAGTISSSVEMLLDLIDDRKPVSRFVRVPYVWHDGPSAAKDAGMP